MNLIKCPQGEFFKKNDQTSKMGISWKIDEIKLAKIPEPSDKIKINGRHDFCHLCIAKVFAN